MREPPRDSDAAIFALLSVLALAGLGIVAALAILQSLGVRP